MRVFADANIFLDNFLKREPNAEDVQTVLLLAEQKHIQLYTSPSILLIIIYYLRKEKLSNEDASHIIRYVLTFTALAETSDTIFLQALSAGFADLEDAVQYYTALHIKGIDYFITSNVRDYKKASPQLQVITPKQFVARYYKK